MVATISTDELEAKLGSDQNFRLIDVLGEEHFSDEHIPGAENIPLDQIGEKALEELDKDEEIVVYCASESCQASPKAAEKLEKLGFTNIVDYEGGLKAWKEAGNQTS